MIAKSLLSATALLGFVATTGPAYAQYLPTPSSDMAITDLCSDIVAHNTYNDVVGHQHERGWDNSSSDRNTHSTGSIETRERGGGGGISLPFIGGGANGRGHSNTHNEQRSNSDRRTSWTNSGQNNSSYQHDRSSTVATAAGRNCDVLNQELGATQRTRYQERTNIYRIDAEERMHGESQTTERYQIDAQVEMHGETQATNRYGIDSNERIQLRGIDATERMHGESQQTNRHWIDSNERVQFRGFEAQERIFQRENDHNFQQNFIPTLTNW